MISYEEQREIAKEIRQAVSWDKNDEDIMSICYFEEPFLRFTHRPDLWEKRKLLPNCFIEILEDVRLGEEFRQELKEIEDAFKNG